MVLTAAAWAADAMSWNRFAEVPERSRDHQGQVQDLSVL